MISGRTLLRHEIGGIWAIDRSEVIEGIYRLVNGALVRERVYHDVPGWPPGEAAKYTPLFEACHDRGGWLYGLFQGREQIAAAVLESHFVGRSREQLQLKYFYVGRAHRRKGLGRELFRLARAEARKRGASGLYVSATPSERTVDFYLGLGCKLTPEPDPALLALEPEDIHLECDLETR